MRPFSASLMRAAAMLLLFLAPHPAGALEILAAGDVTPGYRMTLPAGRQLFGPAALGRIEGADLFIWNCETSGRSPREKANRFVFHVKPEILPLLALKNGVALTANNHVFDGFAEGAADLLDCLGQAGIRAVGLCPGDGDAAPGMKAAEAGDGTPIYLFASSPMVHERGALRVPGLQELERGIRAVRELEPKAVIVVCVHDGIEGRREPSPRQRAWARALALAGADMLLFAHSHLYGPVETIEAEGRRVLVAWSLGNFIFGGNRGWQNRKDVRMLSVTRDEGGFHARWIVGRTEGWRFEIPAAEFIEFVREPALPEATREGMAPSPASSAPCGEKAPGQEDVQPSGPLAAPPGLQ